MDSRMRLATSVDMDAIITLFRDAIADMNDHGIPQWDDIYPTEAILRDDLRQEQLYVLENEAGIVAAVVLNEACDPAYHTIAWQFPGPWVIVHRLCVTPRAQGQGVGRTLMAAVEDWARTRGYSAIRLDAFSLNPHALRMYDRLGYVKRGEAVWRKGMFHLLEKRL